MWEFWEAGARPFTPVPLPVPEHRQTGAEVERFHANTQTIKGAQTLTDVTGADVTARSEGKSRPVAESRPKVRLGVRSGSTVWGVAIKATYGGKFKPEIDIWTKRKGEKKGERQRLASGLAARRVCARLRQRVPVTTSELGDSQ